MTTNKDLYEILGVSKNATDDELKKSYRRLAMRFHPDRQGNKSEAEKKEAEEKFKDIGFAYSILSDPEKRKRYDQFGITDDQQMNAGGIDPTEIFKHFMHGFGGMFDDDDDSNFGPFGSFFGRGRRGQNKNTQASNGQSIKMNLGLSIEELCKGVDKDIKYDIDARCPSCGGKGGEGVETCSHCHGTGMITETQRTGFGIIQNSHPCQYCGGTGETIKKKCSKCNGTGFIRKETRTHVNAPAGMQNGAQILLNGAGYESKDKNMPNGDLLIEFVYNFDQSKYSKQGNSLYEKVEVPYYDCILGVELKHKSPIGETLKIKIPQYTENNTPIYTGKTYGNSLRYYIVVIVKMPKYIRNKERELLENIRKENS